MATQPNSTPPRQERPTPGPGDANTPQEVAQVNDAAQAVDKPQAAQPAKEGAQPQQQAQPTPLEPIQTARPDTSGPELTGNERNDFLFGPTSRPNEPITTGINTRHDRPAVASETLTALKAAASEPGASPALQNLYQLLVYHMGQS